MSKMGNAKNYAEFKEKLKEMISSKKIDDISSFLDEALRIGRTIWKEAEKANNMIKIFLNTEEKSRENYTLKEAIEWFKSNFPKEAEAGCLFKIDKDHLIELHHCFLGKNNKVILDPADPYLVVKTCEISKDLKEHFGDKDLLVLK